MIEDSNASSGALVGDLTGIGKVVNSEIAKRSYDDALSPAMKEVGALTKDSLKAFRLFTAPIQLMAAYQDRFASFCERVRNKVPDEHQREAAPEVARPVMEAFASTSDDSPLMSMFEELMANAIDDRQADKLSPTFAPLIQTLSPLEAKLIAALASNDQVLDVLWQKEQKTICGHLNKNFNFEDFGGNGHHLTIVQNLTDKKLIATLQKNLKQQDDYPSIMLRDGQSLMRFTYRLTMYGRWFANSCVPKGERPPQPR